MIYARAFLGLTLMTLTLSALPAIAADPPAAPESGWVDATGDLGKNGNPFSIAAVPGSDEVLVGIHKGGLFSTLDKGRTWNKLGTDDPPILSLSTCILFDPKDPKTFWTAGAYGWVYGSIFKTTDGGKTFARQGGLSHTDFVAVDFSDPERKTILANQHETTGWLFRTTDGGKEWYNLGKPKPDHDGLPAGYGIVVGIVLLDAKTYVLSTNPAWIRGAKTGMFRTEDAGKTWTKINDLGPNNEPLVASDGNIYWPEDKGFLKSTDQGKTFTHIDAPIGGRMIELGKGKFISVRGTQLYVSPDFGATWKKLGPPMPSAASHFTCSEKANCFYALLKGRIVRWDAPKEDLPK